ncbi:MAG TPA: FAD-binding protein [Chloroflexia bacterium]|nr:FAD-binding protein [Chloroflexia bacterium]
MRIICPIKQVPVVEHLSFDGTTRTLRRTDVPLEINPFDRRAFTSALTLRATHGGSVTALTMGPAQARHALGQCLGLGLDTAVHLCGPEFAGSDTWATAVALAAACRKIGFDLIMCGKYTVDAETGQVGPELAELLGIPHISGVTALTVDTASRTLHATRETDYGHEEVGVPLPALITAAERLIKPLKPPKDEVTVAALAQAEAGGRVQTWSAADLGLAPDQVGLPGSLTTVTGLREMIIPRTPRLIEAADPEAAAQALLAALRARGLFAPEPALAQAQPEASPAPAAKQAPAVLAPGADVWVVAETTPGGGLRRVTGELLGEARRLGDALGGQAVALLLGQDAGDLVPALVAAGAQRVLVAGDPRLARYTPDAWTNVLAGALANALVPPAVVLAPATAMGRDYAPRLAARCALGLTGDCVGFDVDPEGRLVHLKPAFDGHIVAEILARTTPQVATVRPGLLPPWAEPVVAGIVAEPLAVPATPPFWTELGPESREAGTAGIELDDAEIVVCAGTGIGGPEHLGEIGALAAVLGAALDLRAAVGVTRKLVDLGWAPRQLQVGLTGRAVAPRLYLAVGLRGNWNHVVGIARSGTIVAINNDPAADIFRAADIGVVGDWQAVSAALIRALTA